MGMVNNFGNLVGVWSNSHEVIEFPSWMTKLAAKPHRLSVFVIKKHYIKDVWRNWFHQRNIQITSSASDIAPSSGSSPWFFFGFKSWCLSFPTLEGSFGCKVLSHALSLVFSRSLLSPCSECIWTCIVRLISPCCFFSALSKSTDDFSPWIFTFLCRGRISLLAFLLSFHIAEELSLTVADSWSHELW